MPPAPATGWNPANPSFNQNQLCIVGQTARTSRDQRVAYERALDSGHGIWLVPRDGFGARRLTRQTLQAT